MKTFVRLIRRYVLAAVGIVLLLLFSGVAVLGWLGWQEGCRLPQREYSSSEIADSMVETAEGLAFGAERTPQEWMNGYEWAMVLDDMGNIRWSYGLPQELNHAYTPGDIAKFSRWYVDDSYSAVQGNFTTKESEDEDEDSGSEAYQNRLNLWHPIIHPEFITSDRAKAYISKLSV